MSEKSGNENHNVSVKKIGETLSSTIGLGTTAGIIGIIGYGIYLSNLGWNYVYFSFMLAAACYISGFFLGILFGIPKRQNNDIKADYSLNNNLADISDWLTKIIIGLGLIELKKIPVHLSLAGDFVRDSIDSKQPSLKLFAICCIVYFLIFGLYYGYYYMRLYLSDLIKASDNNLLRNLNEIGKELAEEIKEKNIDPNDQININNKDIKKKASEYTRQLINLKKEEDYTFEDWYYKGIDAYYNKKEYELAISSMKYALTKKAVSPKAEADAILYIGVSYIAMGLYEKSLEQFDEIISNYSDYTKMHLVQYNKGVAHGNLKQYENALEAYKNAISLKPDYAFAWNNKSAALIKLNRNYEEALEAANKALEFKPNYPLGFYNKARCYALLNDKDNMILNLKKTIELDNHVKDIAKTNYVFKPYWDDATFKEITQ